MGRGSRGAIAWKRGRQRKVQKKRRLKAALHNVQPTPLAEPRMRSPPAMESARRPLSQNERAVESALIHIKQWDPEVTNPPGLGIKIRDAIRAVRDVDEPNVDGETLLVAACCVQAPAYIELLAKGRKADANKPGMVCGVPGKEDREYTPLEALRIHKPRNERARKSQRKAERVLRECGAGSRAGPETLSEPLREVVAMFNERDAKSTKALSEAIGLLAEWRIHERNWPGEGKKIRALLSQVRDVDETVDGQTLLGVACRRLALVFVKELLEERKADPNKANLWKVNGATWEVSPLTFARGVDTSADKKAAKRQGEIVELLGEHPEKAVFWK